MKVNWMDISELKAELEKHHCSSYGWALSCCWRDRAEAEEVLQTVYLKILEGKARFRGEASFKTWLFAVIRNTAVSERRKSLLRRLRSVFASPEKVGYIATAEKPDSTLERSEMQMQFQRALKQLPRRQRETLHLVFYEDLSLREAADVMGISIGSARTHYERGKKRLRDVLGESEHDYGVEWRRAKNPTAVS
ncbi:MAG: RNA polymerase sigma factor [Acidobacteriota bacterium]|nr:RNA polymerase sigma factor [Acidobacteriota bacterium]